MKVDHADDVLGVINHRHRHDADLFHAVHCRARKFLGHRDLR